MAINRAFSVVAAVSPFCTLLCARYADMRQEASATSTDSIPSTPQTRPSGDTYVSSGLISSSCGDSSSSRAREGVGSLTPVSSPQVSIRSTKSPSSAQQQQGKAVKKKKSFMGTFGFGTKKSMTALSPADSSAETWQTTARGPSFTPSSSFDQRVPASRLNAAGLFSRDRTKSSPKTPSDRILASPKSMSSMMSTDSVNTIATVSPVGRSPVPPTPLRYSSFPDARSSSSQGLKSPFSGSQPGQGRLPAPRVTPRKEDGDGRSFISPLPATPGIRKKRSESNLTQRYRVDAAGRQYEYAPTKSPHGQLGLPSATLADTNPEEWSKYVEAVKREVRKQEQRDITEPLGALPEDGTSKEMDEYALRKRERNERKLKLATQFLHRTSKCGFVLKDGWQEGFPPELSVYETIAEWEKNHVKQDPYMKKTVLERLFKRAKATSSSSTPTYVPLWTPDLDRTPTLSSLGSTEDSTGNLSYDDASDRPLASTPDQDHYQAQGLGISTSSRDVVESTPRALSTAQLSFFKNSPRLASPATPSAATTLQTCTTLPASPLASPLDSLTRDDRSGWETVNDDDEVDIDDDLIEAANSSGSTPDLRRNVVKPECHSSQHQALPPVPHLSPEMRAKYENEAPPAPPSASYRRSALIVRRDSSRSNFSPKLSSEAQQADFDRAIQAAAQRRTDKISKVPVIAGHPALRDNTYHNSDKRSISLPLHVPKLRGSELPTPTRAKPIKPAKPPGLGASLALRKVQEEPSPPGVTSHIPRPPKYGQRISPGKTLDESANLNSATPLPLPDRDASSTETVLLNHRSTTALRDEDNHQNTVSPVEEHMDNVVNAWRGPRTPSMSTIPSYDDSPSMSEAQNLRERLGIPLLEHKRASDPPHPNHKYAWDTINLMCMGIHRGAYEPMNASPSQVSVGAPSPLRGHGDPNISQSIRVESYNTFSSINFNYKGKSCHHCNKTCCYYAEQLEIMKLGFTRSSAIQAAVAKARAHEQELRKAFPSGVEKYDAHIKCSDCGVVCCHEHGVVCKTLNCRTALCSACAEDLGGKCRKHRDVLAEAIKDHGVKTDSLVRTLQERIDDRSVDELIDLL